MSATAGERGDRTHEVPERVERMVSYLLANSAKLARLDRVQVTFNCAGKRIHVQVSESGEA